MPGPRDDSLLRAGHESLVGRRLGDKQRAGPGVGGWGAGSRKWLLGAASGHSMTTHGRLRGVGAPEHSMTRPAICRVKVVLEEDDASLA